MNCCCLAKYGSEYSENVAAPLVVELSGANPYENAPPEATPLVTNVVCVAAIPTSGSVVGDEILFVPKSLPVVATGPLFTKPAGPTMVGRLNNVASKPLA